jgi:hypothetical protein
MRTSPDRQTPLQRRLDTRRNIARNMGYSATLEQTTIVPGCVPRAV